jgi:signal transduction histidine kinase
MNIQDLNVLIVEDDPATAELESRSLKRKGISSTIAGSVKEALSALKENKFSAILLDYNLPDGEAWEIVELSNNLKTKIPVILITAHGSEHIASEAIRNRVSDYIRKSNNFWDLLPEILERATKLSHSEQQLQARNSELEKINADLKKFTYVASNDLKTPLRGIENLAGWIEEDLGENMTPDIEKHLHLMKNRIQRMNYFLDDLMNYFKIGQHHYEPTGFEFTKLLQELKEDYKIPICFELASPISLFTWRVPLEMILRNLIENSVKHNSQADLEINISAHINNHSLVCSVKDNGVGIPHPYQSMAFEMFQTLQSRDETSGTGIGLALVKKTLNTLGGEISINAKYNDGLEIIFDFPANVD